MIEKNDKIKKWVSRNGRGKPHLYLAKRAAESQSSWTWASSKSKAQNLCCLLLLVVVTMAINNNSGDILMLEAPPQPSQPAWRVSADAEVIDALPYIDDDYADPRVKAEVDRLVEEEMRRSSKRPADFLKDLPPLPKFKFEVG